jgi:hypothetical protein
VESASRTRPVVVVVGLVLVGFGVLAIFSVGLPILVAGVFVLVAGVSDAPRRRPRAFWSSAAGLAGLFTGYVLVTPASCTSGAVARDNGRSVPAATHCSNVLGIDYSGGAGYNPPLWPALLVGGGVGTGAAAVVRRRMREDAAP